jgi:serine/threonine protein kinase
MTLVTKKNMSDAEIRAALRLTNGDVAQAVLLLSEPLAGPKRDVPRSARDGGGVTGTRAGKPERPSDPYSKISRAVEMSEATEAGVHRALEQLFDSFKVDTENLGERKRIGQGAFGTVYRVFDSEKKKFFALKEFRSFEIDSYSMVRELAMLSSVNPAIPTGGGDFRFENENVVGFFGASSDWEKADGSKGLAILSEFIFGRDLVGIHTSEMWVHASRIARELFNGLAFIHGKGVAHGDIKPENIMMERKSEDDPYGRVVIVDLGLACFVDYEMATNVIPVLGRGFTCDTRKTEGTPGFIAPELVYAVAKKRNVSIEEKFGNDVWAATLTLFRFFTEERYYAHFKKMDPAITEKYAFFENGALNNAANFYAASEEQKNIWNIGKQWLRDSAFAKYKKDTNGKNMGIDLADAIEFLSTGASSPGDRPTAQEMADRLAFHEKEEKTRMGISAEMKEKFPYYYFLLKSHENGEALISQLYAQLFPDEDPWISTVTMMEAILRFWEAEGRLYNPLGFKLELFTQEGFLGEGSYGKVYRVRYRPTKELFALKELKKTKIASAEDLLVKVDSVRDELIMLASVNPRRSDGTFENKHVAGYIASSLAWKSFDVNVKKPMAMILSELIDGKDLFRFIGVDGTKGWPHYERIAKELFDGLKFIHSKGVAHRDIKGGNVMLELASDGSPYGRAVIVDLGLSCFVEQDLSEFEPILRQERTCRETDVEGGTYYYQSPEIAREYVNRKKEGEPVDIDLHYGADVWALGMTIVEFVCGMRPGILFETMFEDGDEEIDDILSTLAENYSPVRSNWTRFLSVAFSAVEIAAADADEADNYTPFSAIISQSFLHPEQRPNAATMLELLEGIPVLDE